MPACDGSFGEVAPGVMNGMAAFSNCGARGQHGVGVVQADDRYPTLSELMSWLVTVVIVLASDLPS